MNKQDIINLGASFDIPRDDVFLMIQSIMNISSKDLFLLSEIDEGFVSKIQKLFQDRKDGIPLEHILGETDFYGNKFFVNEYTLIPKNDTEILVEKTIEHLSSQKNTFTLVDIGTGTACIPISILKVSGECISAAYAIDISPEALSIAEKNRDFHELSDKLELVEGDLFMPLQDKKFDHLVVTANLPYILDDDFENIDEQVLQQEPHLALFGGEKTGFELYEKLIKQLQNVNALSVIIFIEIGFDQGSIVRDFCHHHKIDFEIYKDNGAVERCVRLKIC